MPEKRQKVERFSLSVAEAQVMGLPLTERFKYNEIYLNMPMNITTANDVLATCNRLLCKVVSDFLIPQSLQNAYAKAHDILLSDVAIAHAHSVSSPLLNIQGSVSILLAKSRFCTSEDIALFIAETKKTLELLKPVHSEIFCKSVYDLIGEMHRYFTTLGWSIFILEKK